MTSLKVAERLMEWSVLLAEFDSELAGVAVFADNAATDREFFEHKSLLRVTNIDVKENKLSVEVGNIFD